MRVAAAVLAPVAQQHELVISHGNGPQVGLLALQASAYTEVEACLWTSWSAETEGMMGYMIEQELWGPCSPADTPLATLLTMIEVARDDPAFWTTDQFVGPQYDDDRAAELAAGEELDLQAGRRSHATRGGLADPPPADLRAPTDQFARAGTVVICAGGGGIPTTWVEGPDRVLTGIEAVIDKDIASELLARELDADLFIMATDVDAVYEGWGTPDQRKLTDVTPEELRQGSYAAGSMGPKVAAAAEFVEHTGRRAAIGSLAEIEQIVEGTAGTNVVARSRVEESG